MSQMKKVAVIIPFYKQAISELEEVSLKQCFKILASHDIIAIKPESLEFSAISGRYDFTNVISFDNAYFKSVQGYNKLMLAGEFYHTFLNYEYILIYQSDAIVFRDELLYWCAQNWDYIGAPWIPEFPYTDIVKATKSKIQQYFHIRANKQINNEPSPRQFEYKVGNGGLSLRRTRKFFDLCSKYKLLINEYNSKPGHFFNEDIFWAIEVNRKSSNLRIPSYKTALKFSIELFPERAYKLNNNNIPFGCHAWDKYLNFWLPIFRLQGILS